MSKRTVLAAGLTVVALGATTLWSVEAGAKKDKAAARTTLRDASGEEVGKVWLYNGVGGRTLVRVRFAADAAGTATSAFHGFHVHANDTGAENGCVANATNPSTSWFTATDGHWNVGGVGHGAHKGDLPSIYATGDGKGPVEMWFQTDKFTPAEAVGRAVIVHDGPDNFGNVPVGAATNQYTANSSAAATLTAGTGNAGVRIACGVIE
jgi:Cu-Zn family superoxide dismutase